MKLHKHYAATTMIVYWFALLAGLSIYTYTRPNDYDVMGLWMGVIIGTVLGNTLAVRDVRIWLVIVIIAGISVLCAPFTPPKQSGLLFWMAFIPATLCGFAALSERGGLVAFWFPSVMWMLTILDHGHGVLKVDGSSAALLGGMACMFLAFLYAREQRRVQMWRTISPTALAPETAPKVLRELPRLRVGIAGWSLIASSVAFALTAWIAPKLWHVEELVPELWTTRTAQAGMDGHGGIGLPCCHAADEFETKRERVKEYFDIGRGHDAETEEIDQGECVVCTPDGRPLDPRGHGYGEYEGGHPTLAYGPDCSVDDPWCVRGYSYTPGSNYSGGYGTGNGYGYGESSGNGDSSGNGYSSGDGWQRDMTPAERRAEAQRQREALARERAEQQRALEEQRQLRLERERQEREDWERNRPERERQERLERERQKELARQMREQRKRDEIALQQERDRQKRDELARKQERQREEQERLERERQDRERQAREDREREEREQREREQIAAAPQPPPSPPPPVVQPEPPPPVAQPAPATTAAATTATARHASSGGGHDMPALSWIAIIIAAGLGMQMLILGLRPVRRLVTLRHLRKPFWTETVDQRVSNWWHLVLVGLRDAGWRTTSGEGPRDLAQRLDIAGVERAATILERARHGVGIDTTDLADMEDAAETAYRASRERASAFQRFLGWFRRPLV